MILFVGLSAFIYAISVLSRDQYQVGDLHIPWTECIHFYTQVKTITTRWFESADESHHDPVWKTPRV